MPTAPPALAYFSYPKAGSVVKPGNRNLNAVHFATGAVAGVHAHKVGVLSLGGPPAIAAAAILAAMHLTPECTVAKLIQRTMIVLAQPPAAPLSAQQTDALYAIFVKLI